MNHVSPYSGAPRVPPVEPELLASAVFHFSEYLEQLAREALPPEEEEEALEDDGPAIDTRQVLDLFAEELGTNVQVTLNVYMRVTALFRLLAASPSLARLAVDQEEGGGALSEDALLAAARLDLHVNRTGADAAADFDPREFREALDQD
jgi:hypothetical protein